MRLFDVHGSLINVDVRESTYPLRAVSKSALEDKAKEYLQTKYFRCPILYEFCLPGSRLTIDFFVPNKGIIIELDGKQHQEYNSFFHGNRNLNKFAKQVSNDRKKEEWAAMNNFKFYRITKEEELNEI